MNIKSKEYDEVRPGVTLENTGEGGMILELGTGGSRKPEENGVIQLIPTQPEKPDPETRAETAIADLHDRYAAKLREQYDFSMGRLRDERDEALRENWILNQQAKAALPEQLAAAGINGGASETTVANLDAQYQQGRNDIRGDYMEEMAKAVENQSEKLSESAENYNEKWIEYLLSLAKMEEEYEKKAELK